MDLINFNESDVDKILEVLTAEFPEDDITGSYTEYTLRYSGLESYIYIKSFDKDLILSYITLKASRTGTGTKILNVLRELGREKGFERIVVQNVLTDAMNDFCEKHKLTRVRHSDILGLDYPPSYIEKL